MQAHKQYSVNRKCMYTHIISENRQSRDLFVFVVHGLKIGFSWNFAFCLVSSIKKRSVFCSFVYFWSLKIGFMQKNSPITQKYYSAENHVNFLTLDIETKFCTCSSQTHTKKACNPKVSYIPENIKALLHSTAADHQQEDLLLCFSLTPMYSHQQKPM